MYFHIHSKFENSPFLSTRHGPFTLHTPLFCLQRNPGTRGGWSLVYKGRGSALSNSVTCPLSGQCKDSDPRGLPPKRVLLALPGHGAGCCLRVVFTLSFGFRKCSQFLHREAGCVWPGWGMAWGAEPGQCKVEAGERVKGYLLARLPAQHTADGEESSAWLRALGSRRALLEQALWALRSGSGLPSPSHGKMVLWPCSCMSFQTEVTYLDQTTFSLQKRELQRLHCTNAVLLGTGFFDGTSHFFFVIHPIFIFFNCSRIDLQCCISFRCTAKWFSYTGIWYIIYITYIYYVYISFFRFFGTSHFRCQGWADSYAKILHTNQWSSNCKWVGLLLLKKTLVILKQILFVSILLLYTTIILIILLSQWLLWSLISPFRNL